MVECFARWGRARRFLRCLLTVSPRMHFRMSWSRGAAFRSPIPKAANRKSSTYTVALLTRSSKEFQFQGLCIDGDANTQLIADLSDNAHAAPLVLD